MCEKHFSRVGVVFPALVGLVVWRTLFSSALLLAEPSPAEIDLVPVPTDVIQAITGIATTTGSVVLRGDTPVPAADIALQLKYEQEQIQQLLKSIRIPASAVASVRNVAVPYTDGPPSDTRMSTSSFTLMVGVMKASQTAFEASQHEFWQAKKREDEAKEERETRKFWVALGVSVFFGLVAVGVLVKPPQAVKDKGLAQFIVGGIMGFWLKS